MNLLHLWTSRSRLIIRIEAIYVAMSLTMVSVCGEECVIEWSVQPPASLVVAQGALILLNAVPNSPGCTPFRYQWRYDGIDLTGATNNSIGFHSIQPIQAGVYDMVATTVSGN